MAFTLSLVLSSSLVNDLAVARWWPRSEQHTAYQVLAQVPATGSVSAQDRYVPHLSLRTLVTVFPVELGRVDYVLVNLDTYPWDELPEVTLERAGDTVTITPAGRQALRFAVAALLRRLNLTNNFGSIYPDPRFPVVGSFCKNHLAAPGPSYFGAGAPFGAGAATGSAAREPAAAVYRSPPCEVRAPDDVLELST